MHVPIEINRFLNKFYSLGCYAKKIEFKLLASINGVTAIGLKRSNVSLLPCKVANVLPKIN